MEHSRISDKTQHEMGEKISIYSLTRVQLKLFFPFFLQHITTGMVKW